MKRDMPLVKAILEMAEERCKPGEVMVISDDDGVYGKGGMLYHIDLMTDAGLLVRGSVNASKEHTERIVVRLTWKGHDALNDFREGRIRQDIV